MTSAYIPKQLRRRLAHSGRHRCGYCLLPERLTGIPMEIDHLVPRSLGGPTEEANLWLACPACNAFKGSRVAAPDPENGRAVLLFNPREQVWSDHFAWVDGGIRVAGKTAVGRATVSALRLNRTAVVEARHAWVEAGWHPPEE